MAVEFEFWRKADGAMTRCQDSDESTTGGGEDWGREANTEGLGRQEIKNDVPTAPTLNS